MSTHRPGGGGDVSAWDLVIGERGANPDLIAAAVLRPGVRARWLVDGATRVERAGFDWTSVSVSALQERLQIARSLDPHVVSLRLRPACPGGAHRWAAASPKVRLEFEGALERTVEKAVLDWLRDLGIDGYLALAAVHPVGGDSGSRASDPHVHVLILEASKHLGAAAAATLRLREPALPPLRRGPDAAPPAR